MTEKNLLLPNYIPKLLAIESKIVRVQKKEKDFQLEIIKKILTKPQDFRSFQDLKTLVPIMQKISFFKERKIKERELTDICLGMQYL